MFVFLYKDFKAIFEIFNGSHEQKSNLKETECGPLSWHYPVQCASACCRICWKFNLHLLPQKSLPFAYTIYIFCQRISTWNFPQQNSQQKFERWVQACEIFMHHWVKMMLPCTCSTNGCSHTPCNHLPVYCSRSYSSSFLLS